MVASNFSKEEIIQKLEEDGYAIRDARIYRDGTELGSVTNSALPGCALKETRENVRALSVLERYLRENEIRYRVEV